MQKRQNAKVAKEKEFHNTESRISLACFAFLRFCVMNQGRKTGPRLRLRARACSSSNVPRLQMKIPRFSQAGDLNQMVGVTGVESVRLSFSANVYVVFVNGTFISTDIFLTVFLEEWGDW
ncbi:hypothetical protein LLG95_09230 [bacterium]|nr:hypothetical protein [bacterium]